MWVHLDIYIYIYIYIFAHWGEGSCVVAPPFLQLGVLASGLDSRAMDASIGKSMGGINRNQMESIGESMGNQ
jgi:hypothetical protein